VKTAIYEKKNVKVTPNKLRWIVAVGTAGVTGKKKSYVRNNKIFAIHFTVTNAQYYNRQFCATQ